MKKRKFLCTMVLSAGMSAALAAASLPAYIYAEEVETAEDQADAEELQTAKDQADAEEIQTAEDQADAEKVQTAENQVDAAEGETSATSGRNQAASGEKESGSEETQQAPKDGGSSSGKTTSSTQTVEEFEYDITVTFTKQRGVLTDISVTSDTSAKNDKFTSKALAGIGEQLKSGSDADVVSGATYSSKAILAAIDEAGDYDTVSEELTCSLNGTAATSSSQSGQSGKGEGSESGKGESGSKEETTVTVPANYITYTIGSDADAHKTVAFTLSPEAEEDNTYVNMVLLVDDNGKHFMPVDSGSDETGNANDYFSYDADTLTFTILNDDLTSIEAIFTSDKYGKVHFTADLTVENGGNEEGAGAKEDDPKDNDEQVLEESGLVQKFLYYIDLDVTVSRDQVTAIEFKNADEIADQNYDYAVSAVEGIQEQIAANPVSSVEEVDVVSGATLSSNAVKKAIADALGEEFDLTSANGKLVMGKNGEVGLADSIKKATNFLKLSDLSQDEDGNYIIPEDKSEAWRNLYELYQEAEVMVNDENASEYDKAILEAKIDQAVAAVQKESGSTGGRGEAVQIDKTRLEALIAEAQAFNEADYTEESWARMNEELEEAIALDGASRISSQDTVDGMVSDLQAAINGLEKKPEEASEKTEEAAEKTEEVTEQKEEVSEKTEEVTEKTEEVTEKTEKVTEKTEEVTEKTEKVTEKTEEKSSSAKSAEAVKTGDNNSVLWMAVCGMAALLGLAWIAIRRKQESGC